MVKLQGPVILHSYTVDNRYLSCFLHSLLFICSVVVVEVIVVLVGCSIFFLLPLLYFYFSFHSTQPVARVQ
jgi:hypothetical protein